MQMNCQTNRSGKLCKLGDDSRTFRRVSFLNHPECIHVFIARGCRRASLALNCSVFVVNSTYLWRSGLGRSHNFIYFKTAAQLPFLRWPTFKQALPHFLRLVAKPGAVGEIQRQTGFRQGILCLLVIRHERGGAVHVVKDLEGEEEMYLCSSNHSASKWSDAA